jgi:hypothetical protein
MTVPDSERGLVVPNIAAEAVNADLLDSTKRGSAADRR